MESKEFNASVYSLVDTFLKNALNGNANMTQLINTNEGQAAKKLIFDEQLVTRRSETILSIVDITQKGMSVLEDGGIERYLTKDIPDKLLKKLRDERTSDSNLKNLELANRFFWLPLLLSVIAIIISLLQLLFK